MIPVVRDKMIQANRMKARIIFRNGPAGSAAWRSAHTQKELGELMREYRTGSAPEYIIACQKPLEGSIVNTEAFTLEQ